jgi:hypothetical protein
MNLCVEVGLLEFHCPVLGKAHEGATTVLRSKDRERFAAKQLNHGTEARLKQMLGTDKVWIEEFFVCLWGAN